MSAWPEAVWIVKKLQKNFDFTTTIDNYIGVLNGYDSRINTLNTLLGNKNAEVQALNSSLTLIKTELDNMASTIRAKNKGTAQNPIPNTSETYTKGTIWVIVP